MSKEIYLLPIEMSDILSSQIEWLRMARKSNDSESFPQDLLSSVYNELTSSITLRQFGMVDFLAYHDSLSGDYFVIKNSYAGSCYWRSKESVSETLRRILEGEDHE